DSGNCTYNGTANTFTCTGVTSFSEYSIGEAETALPVELVAFTGTLDGAAAVLAWQTASETNNAGFSVEMQTADAASWTALSFVEGRGTTLERQRYQYRHALPVSGSYAFRLKQIDYDGTFAYSPIVEMTTLPEAALVVHPAYPNPARDRATLTVELGTRASATIAVYDVLGRQVKVVHHGDLTAQAHRVQVDVTDLAAGLYVLRATVGQHEHAQPLMITR
ncbi:MAG: T9SS type A sorting domain-containing protein, partial [Bacteroidota bacterium]